MPMTNTIISAFAFPGVCIFSFTCLPFLLNAQQVALHGIVTEFNSKFETGKTVYITNAQVEEEYQRCTPTTTRTDGSFDLVLVGIRERKGFKFQVWKSGYEVVNSDQLHAIAGQKDAVRIFMAPRGKIDANRRSYYKIGYAASEKALNQKIEEKRRELHKINEINANNQVEINRLQQEISELYQRFNTLDQSAQELAQRFSRVNLDDASELYQQAFRHFQNGFIDSALQVLDSVNWAARVDSILAEEAKLFALQQVIAFNDSVLTLRRATMVKSLQVEIQAHLGMRQYKEALRTSELLLQLYAADTTLAQMEVYRQVAWLSLLAQEYSLAKLYARGGLEKDSSDLVLQRYLAYSQCLQKEKVGASFQRDHVFREALEADLKVMGLAGIPAPDIELLRTCFR